MESCDWLPSRRIWVRIGSTVFSYLRLLNDTFTLLLDLSSARHQLETSTIWDRTLLWAAGRHQELHEGQAGVGSMSQVNTLQFGLSVF